MPAYTIADELNARLAQQPCVVVTAPPGAGKSTVLPLTILQAMPKGRIIMLEPRRIAARAVAERMADLIGEPVGKTVGYRVRFESKTSAATRIEVVTEGILTRMLIDDPTLEDVAGVIFDEFHERSIHTDVALTLTREAQSVLRPDLRIVIMSATIDATAICHALCDEAGRPAPLVESEGRMFPVTIHHSTETIAAETCAESIAQTVREAATKHEGDILAFLPGEGEIKRCADLLKPFTERSLDKPLYIAPLYGSLPLAEQRRAILPSRDGERKIVLATNIAETSLTIEGVRIVIDSGLSRTMVYDAQSGLSRLETVSISKDMADQRTGRAGRVAEGVCYRLWTMATEHRMAEQRTAEILTADLAPMMLDIMAWGESNVSRLPWITPPPQTAVTEAVRLLTNLKAIDEGHLTKHGRRLAQMPCHPRIGQMLLTAEDLGTTGHRHHATKALACDIAALLEERDLLPSADNDTDICTRLEMLRRDRKRYQRINRIAEQYRHLIHAEEDNASPDPYSAGALIAAAFPERVAKVHADGCGRFLLASGDVAHIENSDNLSAYDWLAVANFNARSGRIFLAAPLSTADLTPLIYIKDNLSWDAKQNTLIARREERVGNLVVTSRPLNDVSQEQVIGVICETAQKRGESMFDFSADAVTTLQNRVAAVAAWHPELDLPDISTTVALQRINEWLPFYLNDGSSGGRRSIPDLKRIYLTAALWSLLSYDQQQAVDRLAPTHITVPTGSRIRLEYRPAAEQPVLRVRLQECFGMQDTPRVDDGRQSVLMELLSPGFKPVQLTQDLRSFWGGTYFEVRKELRRRYPKHHWPDDPLSAEPVRGIKRK